MKPVDTRLWRCIQAVPHSVQRSANDIGTNLAWANTTDALEKASESRFAAIAHLFGNAGHRLLPVAQQLLGDTHSPLGDVLHRWHLHQMCKAFCKGRA